MIDINYNYETLISLYNRYFIEWIADGIIGKDLNIFDISSIGTKDENREKDYETLKNLINEIFSDEKVFNVIYKTFPEKVKEIFSYTIWKKNYPIELNELEVYFNISNKFDAASFTLKDEYLFFKVLNNPNNQGKELVLDYKIARLLRKYTDKKPSEYFIEAENNENEINFKFYKDNNEYEFINNMNFYLDFFNSGEVSIASNGKILKDSKKNMQKHCEITEYYNDVKGLEFLKTETICLLFILLKKQYREKSYFNSKNIKNIIEDFFNTNLFNTEDSYIYTNLFLNYLKGTKNIWKNPEKIKETTYTLVQLLREFPENGIVSVEKIVRAYILREENDLIAPKDITDYIYINEANGQRAKIQNDIDYVNYIIEPFVKSYLFLLSIFGVFEIFYEKPFFRKGLFLKNNYLSKYDGLKYIRLTDLGKYILGYKENFEILDKKEKVEIHLDDKRQFITIVGEAPARVMFFEKISIKIKGNMFKFTYDSFLKGIKTYEELIDRIEKFKENTTRELPLNWQEFFENLEKKFNSIKLISDYVVLKLDDNKELIQLVLKDSRIKKICLKAEDYHLIVSKENLKELVKIFGKYGYYLITD